MVQPFLAKLRIQMPTRERLVRNRLIAPLARRAELWRFTRRTVPRGVAVGLFVGVFLMIPGLQVIGAALLCVPLRANIPLAAVSTFIATPPTIVFMILPAAAAIGSRFGYHGDLTAMMALINRGADSAQWLRWLASDAAPALGLGLVLLALVTAVIGYVAAATIWRWRVMRRRRHRLETARQRRFAR